MLYLIFLTDKKMPSLHSVHDDPDKARAWMECKQHDGADTLLIELVKTDIEMLEEAIEKYNDKQG